MNYSPSVLLYHIYIVNNWKAVTRALLQNVPHDDIYINVNIDMLNIWKIAYVTYKLKKIQKVKKIIYTINSKTEAESRGFKKLRSEIKDKDYALVTYIHGKGVTKPKNDNIKDWVELMRYFIIDRMDLCTAAFSSGYKLYGVNLGQYKEVDVKYGPYKFSLFHFSGNFVTVNLELFNNEFFSTPIDNDYFGVEGFWGKLCNVNDVYCPHISGVNIKNHYLERYPEEWYKTDEGNLDI